MGWFPKEGRKTAPTKREYRQRERALRLALLEEQARVREVGGALAVVVTGVDGAGKGQSVNLLNEWLDPRWIRTRAFDEPSDEERERPPYWRYWRSLPPRGEMTLFLSAWYSEPLIRRAGGADEAWFSARLDEIRRFEQTLVQSGTAVLKLWLHLDQAAQERRLTELSEDPLRSWRVSPGDWENWSRYDAFVAATEEIFEGTHSPDAPWVVIDGADERLRSLEVGEAVLRALRRRLAGAPAAPTSRPSVVDLESEEEAPPRSSDGVRVSKAVYRKELERLRTEIGLLHRSARERGLPTIAVFEGRDASGKGGAIRRLVPAFDTRRVDVVRIAAPTEEEAAHHYLWRFWQRLPRAGYVTLFDRSWYGRVLVERVEGLASPEEWQRAYDEINDFERQLVEHGTVLVKFWLDVSQEEQARRFEERRRVTHKRWKLTDEDLRNRDQWDAYDAAIAAMLSRAQRPWAPWTVIQADDKRHARLEVLHRTAAALKERIEEQPGT